MMNRRRIASKNEWNNFIGSHAISFGDAQAMRMACYTDIERLRGRPLLVYYVKFIRTYHNSQFSLGIDFTDIDGFTDLAYSIPAGESVDVLLHSPGGMPEVTERIVHILRNRFKEVHFLIPHSAYSAATMLALSGNSITMHPEASLGPTDPQMFESPARSILRGFENVRKAILREGPASLPVYQPLLDKCSIQLLEQSKDILKLSKNLVATWLRDYMLHDGEDHSAQIKKATNYFTDSDVHFTHHRSVFFKDIQHLGLNIYESDGELSVLLREAFLLIDCYLDIAFPLVLKYYENTRGISWGTLQPDPNKNPPQAVPAPPKQEVPVEATPSKQAPPVIPQKFFKNKK